MQASIPEFKNDVIKSLTFLRPPERHQAMLDELHVLMQRLLRVITDMNALESEFLEDQATTVDEFLCLTKMISPCALITLGTKFINKLIYTLVNLVLNTLQNFLSFYF